MFAAPAGAKTTKPKKPGPPSGLTALGVEGGATFSWTAPVSDGGSPITGYIVAVRGGGCSTTGATTCTVTGLIDGHAYTAKVRAVNAVGEGTVTKPIKFNADQAPDCSNFVPDADLRYCPLSNANLSGDDLAGADFTGARLNGADFNDANLDGAIFGYNGTEIITEVTFDGAQLVGAQFDMNDVDSSDFVDANLNNAGLPLELSFDNFYGATMAGAAGDGIYWKYDGCPDGTSSNDDGNTCVNNLGPPPGS
jgi:hypothetical protein